MSKYIFVTGGVISSVGKGILGASLGRLLVERGLRVNVQKLDPYINIDAGTLNPSQHGEVFVTEDGMETDMSIGHYERFLDTNFHRNSSITTGQIYSSLITKERQGDYLGNTVQAIPHATSEIKQAMKNVGGEDIDVVIVEVGGVAGDMESLVFLEAIRQFERELKEDNYLHIHVTHVPYLDVAGEVKTKPTQHSVREISRLGLYPDVVVCRTAKNVEFTQHHKQKVAMFCNLLSPLCVIHEPDCDSIYEVPLVLSKQGLDRIACEKLGLNCKECNLIPWENMVSNIGRDYPTVNIAIVGKYTEVPDSYICVVESIKHAGIKNKHRAKITIVSSEDIETFGAKEVLKNYDGIVVPGGFGSRGTEGKILTAQYCRENKVPFIGLCLGLQLACIEYARNVLGIKDATSTEFIPDTNSPVVHLLEKQKGVKNKGGTMRLGNCKVSLVEGTLARRLYGMPEIQERHRHRYAVNADYIDGLIDKGLIISGINEEEGVVEVIELSDHPFYMASQFHPEFKTRPNKPHPLFVGFMNGVINSLKK